MTISPLPSPVVDATAPATGSAGASSEAGADTFAALVLAVLEAGSPDAGSPVAPLDAGATGSTDAAALGADADASGAADTLGTLGALDASGTAETTGTTDATDPASSTGASTGDPAALAALAAQTGQAVVPLPVTLPAPLAAALGLTPASAGARAAAAAPATDATDPTDPTHASAADVSGPTGGPAVNLVDATSSGPVAQTDQAAPSSAAAELAAATRTDQTAPAAQPAGSTQTAEAGPATQTVQATQAPAVATQEGTRPSRGTGAVEPGARAETGTRAERPAADAPTSTTDPAPTFVQGSSAPTRAEATAPTTSVTRAAAAQVVPELTRLVQAGPGTHRVVLRLDPEHLGEVRITLTVHPGGVRVRMSTGTEDARAALNDGLHALHRALETVPGRPTGDTQVAVLHQPRAHETGTSADGQGGLSGQTGDAQASPHQTPGDRPQADDRAGRPARTQVDTTARDGSQGGGTSGTPRPADPPTSGRSARLDVSM